MRRFTRIVGRALLFVTVGVVALYGHEETIGVERPDLNDLWNFEPASVVSLFVVAALYLSGVCHMPKRIRRDGLWFLGGWLLLVVAIISPVHRWGAWLFSVHMTQHELLMIGAAPLIALGRPGIVVLRAFPTGTARGLMHLFEVTGLVALWKTLCRPAVAWIVHAAALWAWHIPALFELTFSSEWIHTLQHASFFGTALLFWHSLFREPRGASHFAWGIFNLFVTAVHSSVLGALITFSPRTLYSSYLQSAPQWGLTALQDQQIGGLIMWVPAGLVYILCALCLLYSQLERRTPPTLAALGPADLDRRPSI